MTNADAEPASALDRSLWWVAIAFAGTSLVMVLLDVFEVAETSGDLRSGLALAGLLIFLVRPRTTNGRPAFIAIRRSRYSKE